MALSAQKSNSYSKYAHPKDVSVADIPDGFGLSSDIFLFDCQIFQGTDHRDIDEESDPTAQDTWTLLHSLRHLVMYRLDHRYLGNPVRVCGCPSGICVHVFSRDCVSGDGLFGIRGHSGGKVEGDRVSLGSHVNIPVIILCSSDPVDKQLSLFPPNLSQVSSGIQTVFIERYSLHQYILEWEENPFFVIF